MLLNQAKYRFNAMILSVAVVMTGLPAALARESVAISTPFEVSESPAGNYLAALVAGAERDTLAASTYFQEALRFDPRNPELLERAFVASLANGSMPEAFRLAQRLQAKQAANSLAQLSLGVKALKARQFVTARGFFAKSGSARDRDVTGTLLAAWALAGSGEGRKALEMVDRLPGDSFGVFRDFHAAMIAEITRNPEEALKRIKSAYAGEKNLRVVDAYARMLSRRGNAAEARQVYESFDAINPRHPLVMAAMAQLKAGKTLEPLVQTAESGAAEVLYGLGSAGGRQGDELAALVYLRLSLFLRGDNGLAIVTVADIYDRLRQPERAIDAYEMVPDDSPLRTNADIQTGLTLETMGKGEDALKLLEGIVKDHPAEPDALVALGNLQRSRKDYTEAAKTYTRLIDLNKAPAKADWSNYYNRGVAFERSKQWPMAEADFKKALELFPDQPSVLNYLGYSWIDQGINLDEGFKMLRRAVDQRPEDGYIIDSLGWAFYRLGRYEEATRELERAIEKKPSDPVLNDHLGDAYWQIGRKLEAKFQWNHARDLKPEPDDLPAILKKIENGLGEQKPIQNGQQGTSMEEPAKNGG